MWSAACTRAPTIPDQAITLGLEGDIAGVGVCLVDRRRDVGEALCVRAGRGQAKRTRSIRSANSIRSVYLDCACWEQGDRLLLDDGNPARHAPRALWWSVPPERKGRRHSSASSSGSSRCCRRLQPFCNPLRHPAVSLQRPRPYLSPSWAASSVGRARTFVRRRAGSGCALLALHSPSCLLRRLCAWRSPPS